MPQSPKSLAEHCQPFFEPIIRQRGDAYAGNDVVNSLHASPVCVTALVDGVQVYQVYLHTINADNELFLGCNCPYAEDALCKHLWALLLTCDARGLGQLETESEVKVLKGNPSQWEALQKNCRPIKEPDPEPAEQTDPDTPEPWRNALASVLFSREREQHELDLDWPAEQQLIYTLRTKWHDQEQPKPFRLVVQTHTRKPKRAGGWAKPLPFAIRDKSVDCVPDPIDQKIMALLTGAEPESASGKNFYTSRSGSTAPNPGHTVPAPVEWPLAEALCQSKRLFLDTESDAPDHAYNAPSPLTGDGEDTWTLHTSLLEEEDGLRLRAELRRPAAEQPETPDQAETEAETDSEPTRTVLQCGEIDWITHGGLILHHRQIGRFVPAEASGFIQMMAEQPDGLLVPAEDEQTFVESILTLPGMPPVSLPKRLEPEHRHPAMQPKIRIQPTATRKKPKQADPFPWLEAKAVFDYDGFTVPADEPWSPSVMDKTNHTLIHRDTAAETRAMRLLTQVGFEPAKPRYQFGYGQVEPKLGHQILTENLKWAVVDLYKAGWEVQALDRTYRAGAALNVSTTSGIDWFEVSGEVRFGDASAKLPDLMEAIENNRGMVKLDDGSFGVLPEAWLTKYAGLFKLAKTGADNKNQSKASGTHQDTLHIQHNQIGLLDALLETMPEVRFDKTVTDARKKLQGLGKVKAKKPTRAFKGKLRHYQEEGLGWMQALQQAGLNGCLADDMGLGKTVQVLAMFEARRAEKQKNAKKKDAAPIPPSLLVVPTSLLDNWQRETQKFAPKINLLNFTGPNRKTPIGKKSIDQYLKPYDVVLTTYGHLRTDAGMLSQMNFDYAVLDEAQAIKNEATTTAKAARIIRADHKLAVSGTPIENSLKELFSLFSFLNPGMLDDVGWGQRATGSSPSGTDMLDVERKMLAKAVRPFILRRTKTQVAPELPDRTETTLFCELPTEQRKLYDDLREHYRIQLADQVNKVGLNRSKIQVLEALLRLRQAACHPALIDPKHADMPTAKFELLNQHLHEIMSENHKALVFSQFVGMLSIVREPFDAEGIPYAYLDGKTKDRQAEVDRFQNDPDTRLMLISLKAGGVGLNLTQAEYVFLLDPWWNPAAEAQAIDRAHRIGQSRHVMAYRLIAKNTVEEKVLELQNSKRDLADAIISADNSVIQNLSADDLQMLLS